jgi:hypothetical protein
VADQFLGHRIDASALGMLASGKTRQAAGVGARKVASDVGHLRRHQMKVVEEPLCGGGDEIAGPDVVCQRTVRLAQHADVLVETPESVLRRSPGIRIDREPSGKRSGVLLDVVAAEDVAAERPFRM